MERMEGACSYKTLVAHTTAQASPEDGAITVKTRAVEGGASCVGDRSRGQGIVYEDFRPDLQYVFLPPNPGGLRIRARHRLGKIVG